MLRLTNFKLSIKGLHVNNEIKFKTDKYSIYIYIYIYICMLFLKTVNFKLWRRLDKVTIQFGISWGSLPQLNNFSTITN